MKWQNGRERLNWPEDWEQARERELEAWVEQLIVSVFSHESQGKTDTHIYPQTHTHMRTYTHCKKMMRYIISTKVQSVIFQSVKKTLDYKTASVFFGIARKTFQNLSVEAHRWNSRSSSCHTRGCLMTAHQTRRFTQRGSLMMHHQFLVWCFCECHP